MLNKLKTNLSTCLNCSEQNFEHDGVYIIKPNTNFQACGDKGVLAISTGSGVVVQCDNVYYEELKNVYEESTKLDFFELNNLTFLESLVRHNSKLLAGPYLVLHADSVLPLERINNSCRLEIRQNSNKDLYQYEGFDNALSYNDNNNNEISLIVWHNHQPISIATASYLYGDLYNIGINVLPEWRKKGIATIALTRLTEEIINRDKIPHYSVSIANTASINLALKVGYKVSYTTVYTV